MVVNIKDDLFNAVSYSDLNRVKLILDNRFLRVLNLKGD